MNERVEFENDAGAPPAGAGGQAGAQAAPGAGAGAAGTDASADWRSQFALEGDDGAKLSRYLERFKSPQDLAKSYLHAQATISRGGVKLPGEKATPDEIAAFNKAFGVPEKPDAYKLTRPQGIEAAPEAEGKFLAAAHAAGLNQKQVDAVLGHYWSLQGEALAAQRTAQQEQQRIADETRAATGRALDEAWGYARENNLGRINQFLAPYLEGEEKNFLHLRLADGSLLGDNMALIKALDEAARLKLGDGKFAANDASDKAVNDELAELEKLRRSDFNRYKSDSVQNRIKQLIAAQIGA